MTSNEILELVRNDFDKKDERAESKTEPLHSDIKEVDAALQTIKNRV